MDRMAYLRGYCGFPEARASDRVTVQVVCHQHISNSVGNCVTPFDVRQGSCTEFYKQKHPKVVQSTQWNVCAKSEVV